MPSASRSLSTSTSSIPLQTPDYEQELAENGQRILTFLVYLNDDYEGGKTEMPLARRLTQRAEGRGVVFRQFTPER